MIAPEPGWGALLATELRAGAGSLLNTGMGPEEIAARCRGGLHYLATPYSREVVGAEGWCRVRSIEMALRAAEAGARLARHGVTAIAPVVQAAEMVHVARPPLDPLDDGFWAAWCAPLLAVSSSVIVPELPGWDRSRGIWREVAWALGRNMPVHVEAAAPGARGTG